MEHGLDLAGFALHPQRGAVLGEVHARPFTRLSAPLAVLRFAFLGQGEAAAADRQAFVGFCTAQGLAAPEVSAKHHQVSIGAVSLRWEQHSEFTTFTWIWSNEASALAFAPIGDELTALIRALPQTGQLLVAVRLEVEQTEAAVARAEELFDKSSLAMATVRSGPAVVASDFRADAQGFVRILICNDGLSPGRLGALVQRVLEIETYRTLALLGLPAALELAPSVDHIGRRLVEVLQEMQGAEDLKLNNHLLTELTALAASLERGAAGSLFRFGASRAYYDIVQARLGVIEGSEIGGRPTWSSFLARRMAPAMRTCAAMEDRQANLSIKLARAADLLRTRVDVELEEQNRDLLRSMNERTKLQLRLQSTVEGLSVAAIGYYVVSLFGYLAKGAHDGGLHVEPSLATALFVPFAVGLIWIITHRIRQRHLKHEGAPGDHD
ncbi:MULTISPECIES: DUF3422 domain-containing protein [Bradyrhizobium]|uniref:DUF3422 domain-containing protein n=3 Tax=Bradyrhizobium TaxID=374 RepID=A0A410VIQ6_9BRAD|nr:MULTISPECIES: DUF3422 domain-containing protein [Bradyrhizobium]MCG2628051.1 DUF3422 domain-containing protein [Bradyrhizobium zhengyangense]MCG2643170.1 DUF3422 domain-containing protein [Bradyrhizobium zhengyangense]MCG2670516.1 DUF3422 domain-containing protein [Bradyrhizobium zhengyangense]MDN4985749.1 DUF3422 domain-containing protein [Bradyrhizobium sp. WYCCWR 13022]MDT4736590.1 DUF3422 domain-containing protein [Bradyrhizobium sp. WYCCWR 12699]